MHPLFYLIAEFAITALVVGLAPPKGVFRPAGLVSVAYCVWKCIPNCMPYMVRTPWAALVGGFAVAYAYHYLDVALLSRWDYAHQAPSSGLVRPSDTTRENTSNGSPNPNGGFRERVYFGVKIASSFRFIGTPFEVSNVPSITTTDRRDFVRRTVGIIALSYVVLDVINSSNDPGISSRFLTLDKVPFLVRLKEVTAEEVVIRFFTVLAAGISLNCVQGGMYYIFALLAVSSGVSQPADWPPFYGSPSRAYRLWNFWNIFWHQTNARKFSSIAHYTVHDLLKVPRGTTIGRYSRILAAFLSSAMMHLLCDLSSGISVHDSGAIRFFVTQACGIILEDVVIRTYRAVQVKRSPGLEKSIGFMWVAIFLAWSVPAYLYPMMWRGNLGLNDSVIPFSLFGSTGA